MKHIERCLSGCLKHWDTTSVSVGDGHELVDSCKSVKIDLVFADFHLPDMDGLAAAEHLAGWGIPVVIISGHEDAENIVVDHEPIEMVLRKPATIGDLRKAIQHVLNGDWKQKNQGTTKLGS
jgi:CheY-like chemotaxis protein